MVEKHYVSVQKGFKNVAPTNWDETTNDADKFLYITKEVGMAISGPVTKEGNKYVLVDDTTKQDSPTP